MRSMSLSMMSTCSGEPLTIRVLERESAMSKVLPTTTLSGAPVSSGSSSRLRLALLLKPLSPPMLPPVPKSLLLREACRASVEGELVEDRRRVLEVSLPPEVLLPSLSMSVSRDKASRATCRNSTTGM